MYNVDKIIQLVLHGDRPFEGNLLVVCCVLGDYIKVLSLIDLIAFVKASKLLIDMMNKQFII